MGLPWEILKRDNAGMRNHSGTESNRDCRDILFGKSGGWINKGRGDHSFRPLLDAWFRNWYDNLGTDTRVYSDPIFRQGKHERTLTG